jgi:hypothetical protein
VFPNQPYNAITNPTWGEVKDFFRHPLQGVYEWGTYLLGVLLPPSMFPGGNTTIEIPRIGVTQLATNAACRQALLGRGTCPNCVTPTRSQKQKIIDEFFGGRPTRLLPDRNTGEIVGEMTTDSGPVRKVIYEHTDSGTPRPHINLHDDATGTNIHVVLK